MNLPQFYQNNKKAVWIMTTIVVVAILLIVIFIWKGSQNNLNNQPQQKHDDQIQITYLPSKTCPDNNLIFMENNEKRADLNGKPYKVLSADEAWIQQNCSNLQDSSIPTQSPTNSPTQAVESEPPLLLRTIGFKLDAYNSKTLSAGEMKFTKVPLLFDEIFAPFGQQDPRTTDTTKKNPQPVFILPLGTNVLSLVDGEVVDVKQLYSTDYTVMVAKSKTSPWIYETEHILAPTVKVGDKVTAGQILGKVSDYESKSTPGFGLVEIGILHGGMVPEHVCPFQYMDPSIKDTTNANISSLYSAWEAYIKKDIYIQETFKSPGCVIEGAVKG
jgi:hypothetical protein